MSAIFCDVIYLFVIVMQTCKLCDKILCLNLSFRRTVNGWDSFRQLHWTLDRTWYSCCTAAIAYLRNLSQVLAELHGKWICLNVSMLVIGKKGDCVSRHCCCNVELGNVGSLSQSWMFVGSSSTVMGNLQVLLVSWRSIVVWEILPYHWNCHRQLLFSYLANLSRWTPVLATS